MGALQSSVDRVAGYNLMSPGELASLTAAVERADADAIRSIGNGWSGLIALDIFQIADAHGDTEK
ncbi:hypothetical protein [Streptomyces decoyicus]|uniref:hypothetical protein n=1 Tax=Streptomyces decoyicus TaxID=249567 RepID=UPI0033A75F46